MEVGDTRTILEHPAHPYTKGLVASLPAKGMNPIGRAVRKNEGNSGCSFYPRCPYAADACKNGTIQIIFQHPETSLDPAKKIGYSLEEPMIIHKMYDKAGRKKRVKELLDLVDLGEELLDRYPHQISGGEAQRIMIARALSLDPKILILDEPTSMLDVSVQAQVMTLLKELQEKLGLSYLFISHDLDVVRWFCDEIAVMEEGKFVETGRTEDVIGHPKAEFTKKLVESFILE